MRTPQEFNIMCLWSGLGLALTALDYMLGFGVEVGLALAVAG
jgi:hypothetical protein